MMNKNIIIFLFTMASQLPLYSTAFARSGGGAIAGGGGDATEVRFDEIRSDIAAWINNGGPRTLELQDLSNEEYVSKMSDILLPRKVIVGFIEKDDDNNDELKVSVGGSPKTCRGFISQLDSQPHIICNISRFKETDEASQYRLVHHEYAGLAGIEKNDGAASDYSLSSQLTSYLSRQTVLKLAIKKEKIIEKEDPRIAVIKSRYVGNDTFEVTIAATNGKDIQKIILTNGKHSDEPRYKCNVQMPVIELKNDSLEQTISLKGTDCNKSTRKFEFKTVIVQYNDGSIKNFGSFKGNYGFDKISDNKIVHLKIDTLKDKTFIEKTPRKKKEFQRKEQLFRIGFQIQAEDLINYDGVIFSDGSEFFSDDSNKLADEINSKELILEINGHQVWYIKNECNFLYCSEKEIVDQETFSDESHQPTPFIALIKKTKLPEINIQDMTEFNNFTVFQKINWYSF